MEATGEVKGILGKIIPPRLEDAGLEDCALPPEAIKEAFAKAATAVRSIISASSDEDEVAEGHCVKDPWPVVGDSSDTLVGITDGVDDVPGGCSNEKGGGLQEVGGDEVVVRDEDKNVDEVVVGGPPVTESGEKACVDGLLGLQIGEKNKGKSGKGPSGCGGVNDVDADSEENESEVPVLTEAYV